MRPNRPFGMVVIPMRPDRTQGVLYPVISRKSPTPQICRLECGHQIVHQLGHSCSVHRHRCEKRHAE